LQTDYIINRSTEVRGYQRLTVNVLTGCLVSFQASNQVAALLAAIALGLAIIPTRWIAFVLWANVFTSGMQSQKQSPSSNSVFHRRFNEWWYSIPVVPVRFLKPGEKENADKVD